MAVMIVDVKDAFHGIKIGIVALVDALTGLGACTDADGIDAVVVVVVMSGDGIAQGVVDGSEQNDCKQSE